MFWISSECCPHIHEIYDFWDTILQLILPYLTLLLFYEYTFTDSTGQPVSTSDGSKGAVPLLGWHYYKITEKAQNHQNPPIFGPRENCSQMKNMN